MGAVRIIVLVVAAVAAIILAIIVGKLVGHKPAPAPVVAAAPKAMTQVVVAKHDLAVGASVGPDDLTWQPWPAEAVNAAFITDGHAPQAAPQGGAPAIAAQTQRVATTAADALRGAHSPMDALYGAIVRMPILANEPVTNAKLVRGGQGGYMAVVLQPGMRAVAVPISQASAAGGFILPGDRVDVLQAHQLDSASGGQKQFISQTVMHNVRVLAVDQTSQPPKNGGQSQLGAVATLEVNPTDAEVLIAAKAAGELTLDLRSYADAGGPSGASGLVRVGSVHIIRPGQAAADVTVTP